MRRLVAPGLPALGLLLALALSLSLLAACDDGASCTSNADCPQGVCVSGQCASSLCYNRVQDGDETGVDCGGSCGACEGEPCTDGVTCASGSCSGGSVCVAAACANDPCLHGGTCREAAGGFACTCPDGWAGSSCQVSDGCFAAPCGDGSCIDDGDGGYRCSCFGGSYDDGTTCAPCPKPIGCEVAACSSATDAQCVTCGDGFVGDGGGGCADVDDCGGAPCGVGTCVDAGVHAYTCSCPAGYYDDGATCATCAPMTGCEVVTCTSASDASCDACADGYQANGSGGCQANSGCALSPCGAGTCVPGSGDGALYTCECPAGEYDDGVTCAACLLGVGCASGTCTSAGDTTCATCLEGFESDGAGGCRDIDDCAGDPCGDGTCEDAGVNAYTCTCAAGFYEGGGTCVACVAPLGCALATCTSAVDAVCGECASGFASDGAGGCADVDDCAGDPCGAGTCTDTGANAYVCACDVGGYADGGTCKPCGGVEGCALASCTTAADAVCVTCADGWEGDGAGGCQDIDDCAGSPCGVGTCTDAGVNAYTCACPAGHYDDGATCASCAPKTGCAVVSCTSGTDATCTLCADGYQPNGVGGCQSIDGCASEPCGDGTCHNAPPLYGCDCPADQWFDGTTCAALTVCTAGEYESKAATATTDRECTALTTCTAAEYESKTATTTSNRECTALTTCTAGEYESKAATTTTDRECTALTTCTAGEYESTSATSTSDRECTALTACTADQYQSTPATETTDRVCSALTVCTADQYESTSATSTSDRECTALTACTADQYQSTPATETTDRVCSALTVCTADQYESTSATSTSDRECTALTACTAGEYESQGATATSDRECAACAPVDDCLAVTCLNGLSSTCVTCADDYDLLDGACVLSGPPELGLDGVELAFRLVSASPGFLFGAVTASDTGDGSFAQGLTGLLSEPAGAPGDLVASVGTVEGHAAYASPQQPAATLNAIMRTSEVWRDAGRIGASVQVRDALGQSQVAPTVVTLRVTLTGKTPLTAVCTTGADGTCDAVATVPTSWFGAADAVAQVQATTGALTTASESVTLHGYVAPVAPAAGVSLVLPLGPRRAGTSFVVPVSATTNGHDLGAFDLSVVYDATILEVASVSLANTLKDGVWNVPELGTLKLVGVAGPATRGPFEVAQVTFQVKAGASVGGSAAVSGVIEDLLDPQNAPLVAKKTSMTGFGALVVADDPIRGIVATSTRSQLVDVEALTGAAVTSTVRVRTVRAALPDVDVTASATCEGVTPCVIAAGATAGARDVKVKYEAHEVNVPVRVWKPTLPVTVQIADATLERIAGFQDVACGAARFQDAAVTVEATFGDGETTFTGRVAVALESADDAVATVSGGRVRGVAGGTTAVRAVDPDGAVLGEATVTVSDTAIAVLGLDVVVVTGVTVDPVPAGPTDDPTGARSVTARARQVLEAEGAQGTVLVWARLADGTRAALTAADGVVLESLDPTLLEVTSDPPQVTALAAGQGELVGATWESCGAELADGVGAVVLALPAAVDGLVTVSQPRIAVSAADPAALAGVATDASVTVRLDYENETSADFTLDTRTQYDDTSGDPDDLFAVVADETGVRVVPTGNGVGQATLKVSFSHTPVALTALVNVVQHERFELAARPWPVYPGSGAVSEVVLSPLEGTGIWQQASLELVTVLTDDHRIDVSTRSGTSYSVTGSALEVVNVNRVHALEAGTATVVGSLGGAVSGGLGITIAPASAPVTVTAVTTSFPTTFSGMVGATRQLTAVATFDDGTVQLTAHTISGLLAFASSDPGKVSVDAATGLATIHDNHNRLVTLTASASQVSGSSNTAANLLPVVGDVDLGETVGVAHPDRSPGAMFVMPLRVNTGGAPLGALDVTVRFDPAVIKVVSVDVGAGWPGGQFDSSVDNVGGEVHLVAAAKAGSTASGAALEVAKLTFRAADGQKSETLVAGSIAKMLDNTLALAPIGPELGVGETRAIVAGAGLLDPDCGSFDASEVRGNTNGNCEFEVGDVSFTLQYLAGLVSAGGLEGYQVVALDANGDGAVTVADAVYLLRVLVGKFAFASFTSKNAAALADEVVLEARLWDKTGAARSVDVAVFFELGTSQALTVSQGTTEATTANGRVVRADNVGGGLFRARLTGFAHAESEIGVVPVVRTVDAEGQDADDRVAAFYGTPWVSELMAFVPWGTVDVAANGCFVNPCGSGTCNDLGAGEYSCTCPAGQVDNDTTCVACPAGTWGTDGTCTAWTACGANAVELVAPSATTDRQCACAAGYEGDAVAGCTDVNECATNNGGCDANATCTNTVGGFTCECKSGYEGSGTSCTDVNECATNNDDCDANATCTNTVGGFTCECKSGYEGSGTSCTDVDECATGTDTCGANTVCTNVERTDSVPLGFTCACASGFTGDAYAGDEYGGCIVVSSISVVPGEAPDEQDPRAVADAPAGFGSYAWQGPSSGKTNWHARYQASGDALTSLFPARAAGLQVKDLASISYWTKRLSDEAGRDWFIQIYTRPQGEGADPADARSWYHAKVTNNFLGHDAVGTWTRYSTRTGMTFDGMTLAELITARGDELVEMVTVQIDSLWDGFDGLVDGLEIELTGGEVGRIDFTAGTYLQAVPNEVPDEATPRVSALAPPGYGSASWQAPESGKTNWHAWYDEGGYGTLSALFPEEASTLDLADIGEIAYSTFRHVGATNHDWFVSIYTRPESGDAGWYHARYVSNFDAHTVEETWVRYTTSGASGAVPAMTFRAQDGAGNPVGESMTLAQLAVYDTAPILSITVQTGSAWTGFDGLVDGLEVHLTDGRVGKVDFADGISLAVAPYDVPDEAKPRVVFADAPAGFGPSAWQAPATGKTNWHAWYEEAGASTLKTLFPAEAAALRIEDLRSIAYATKRQSADTGDWWITIYTRKQEGDATWYHSKYINNFDAHTAVDSWTRYSTRHGSGAVPAMTFQRQLADNSLTGPVMTLAELGAVEKTEILSITIQTASDWPGFGGYVDGLEVVLNDGRVGRVNTVGCAPGEYAVGNACVACPGGTWGDAGGCHTVTECGANQHQTAAPTPTSDRVCACDSGYAPAGSGATCVDVDECGNNTDNCDANATCTNTVGGFTCECKSGYEGSGTSCTDVNECATNNGGCGAATFWLCTNNEGGAPTCTDIDECATNNGGCGDAGFWHCANNAGGAPTCTDIDECATSTDSCGANTVCTNAERSEAAPLGFTCACAPGFTGDPSGGDLYGGCIIVSRVHVVPGEVPDEAWPRVAVGDAPVGWGPDAWQAPLHGKTNYFAYYYPLAGPDPSSVGPITSLFPSRVPLTLTDLEAMSYYTKRPAGTLAGADWWITIYTFPLGSGDPESWYHQRFVSNYGTHTSTGAWTQYTTEFATDGAAMMFRDIDDPLSPWLTLSDLAQTYGAQLVGSVSLQTDSEWEGFDGLVDGLEIVLSDGDVGRVDLGGAEVVRVGTQEVPDEREPRVFETPTAEVSPPGYGRLAWQGPANGKSNWYAMADDVGDGALTTMFGANAKDLTLGHLASLSYWTRRPDEAARDWWITLYTRPKTGDSGWYHARYINDYDAHTAVDAWARYGTAFGTGALPPMTFRALDADNHLGAPMTLAELIDAHGADGLLAVSLQTDSLWDGFDGAVDGLEIALADGRVGRVDLGDVQTFAALPAEVPDEQEPRALYDDAPPGYGPDAWVGPAQGKTNWYTGDAPDGSGSLSRLFPGLTAPLKLRDLAALRYATARPMGAGAGQDWWITVFTRPKGDGQDASWYRRRFVSSYSDHTAPPNVWTRYSTEHATGTTAAMTFREYTPESVFTGPAMSLASLGSGAYGGDEILAVSLNTDSVWGGFDGAVDGLEIELTNGRLGRVDLVAGELLREVPTDVPDETPPRVYSVAPPGFGPSAWQAPASGKTNWHAWYDEEGNGTLSALFPEHADTLSLSAIASISYATLRPEGSANRDWFVSLYTRPLKNGTDAASWYHARYVSNFDAHTVEGAWVRYTTRAASGAVPPMTFRAQDADGNPVGVPMTLAELAKHDPALLLSVTVQTGSAWGDFGGAVDGLEVTLEDGTLGRVDFTDGTRLKVSAAGTDEAQPRFVDDAPPGYGPMSWQAPLTGKTNWHAWYQDDGHGSLSELFPSEAATLRLAGIASISYWTKRPDEPAGRDWWISIYTRPDVGESGWYHARYISDFETHAARSAWVRYTTTGGGEEPAMTFRAQDDGGNPVGPAMTLAELAAYDQRAVLSVAIQTASIWQAFDGLVDGLEITLKTGLVGKVDLTAP